MHDIRVHFSEYEGNISWTFWKVYEDECNIWYTTQPADRTACRNRENYDLQWLYFIFFTVTHTRHPCIPPITPFLFQDICQWNMKGRVILKRYLGTARYEKAFKGPRRKVSPELDSWLNSDQFWLQNHFCSSKDKKVRIISVKAKIALPSCKSCYLAYELNWYHYHFFFAKIAIYISFAIFLTKR